MITDIFNRGVSNDMIKNRLNFYGDTNEAQALNGQGVKMTEILEIQEHRKREPDQDIGFSRADESTLKRQTAYNQAIERFRDDLNKRARPLPVLFDDDGKWAF